MNSIFVSTAAPNWSFALTNLTNASADALHFAGAAAGQAPGGPGAFCFAPFVATQDPRHQVSFLPGCGLSCHDTVWYAEEDYSRLRQMIITLASLSLILTAFTLASSLVDPRQRQFPAVLLLNINICLFASSVAWIWTFAEGDDIICYEDGTLRLDAPSEVGDFKCVLSFMIIFYFTMAAHVWFVLLAIAWNFAFLHLGKPKQSSASATRKLLILQHVIAWTLPALLTGAALGTMQLDGLWLGRICHLSLVRENNHARVLLLLVPEGVTVVLGAIFLTRGAIYLEKLRRQQTKDSFLSDKSNKLIKETIVKIGVFSLLLLGFHLINIGAHVTESVRKDSWIKSFEDFVRCRGTELAQAVATTNPDLAALVTGEKTQCVVEDKPQLSVVFIGFIGQVAIGIAMGTWGVNRHSLSKWKQCFVRLYKMLTTYHGQIDLHKERVASDGSGNGGERRMSGRSVLGQALAPPDDIVSHELEMYANPLVIMEPMGHLAPPSPVSPVNLHANPISYHGKRVNVTQSVSTTLDSEVHSTPDPGPSNPYGTWPGSPSKKASHGIASDRPSSWKPTPPKRNRSNHNNVQLISHKKSEDPDKISSPSPELNSIIPRNQMSLPRSIVGTGRYVLQAANFAGGDGEMSSAESALYHGRPLSEKDKKRAIVVIEMTDDEYRDA